MDETYNIHSFVIRIIPHVSAVDNESWAAAAQAAEPAENRAGLQTRIAVRHIQSNQERNFASWPDAVTFMETFVPLPGLPTPAHPALPVEEE